MKKGIIVLGHGSKAPEALESLKEVAEGVAKKMGDYPVSHASMGFNQPDLPTAIKDMVDKGVQMIVVAPYFLYFGIHVQEDIPNIIAREKDKYEGLEIVFANPLGSDDRLVSVIADRVKEVV